MAPGPTDKHFLRTLTPGHRNHTRSAGCCWETILRGPFQSSKQGRLIGKAHGGKKAGVTLAHYKTFGVSKLRTHLLYYNHCT